MFHWWDCQIPVDVFHTRKGCARFLLEIGVLRAGNR